MEESKEPRKLPLYDINLTAFLKLHNVPIELRKVASRVVFEIPATDEAYRLMEAYQENPPVSVLDFVSVLRELRGRMVSHRDPRKERGDNTGRL